MSMIARDQDKINSPLPPELTKGGNADKFSVVISNIVTSDGTEIEPPHHGITVIVGGNNAGKSTFLRDIWTRLSRPSTTIYKTQLLKDVKVAQVGEGPDLFAWLEKNVGWYGRSSTPGFPSPTGYRLKVTEVKSFIRRDSDLSTLDKLSSFLVHRGDLHKRLEMVEPVDQRDDLQDPPKHPIHKIQGDPELLKLVQDLSERIFRQKLTLDRLGRKTQLRVGATRVPPPPVDAVTPAYTHALNELEPLNVQGDGMKSLMGLLLPLVTASSQIMLVDEPEAFLHPPQAKIVGRVLGELAAERRVQIFLATHDRNLLVGLLESGAPVSVVRLDRGEDTTHVHELSHQKVRDLWDDPTLRYSNVLDGLFHRAVVLAEADGDCRFFAASLEGAGERKKLHFVPGDILFVPVGGKDGFPRVVKALNSVSVPTIVVPDLDILNDSNKLRALVDALGGDWSTLEKDYRLATEQFRKPRSRKTRGQILELVKGILNEGTEMLYDKETEGLIQAAIRLERSPWQDLKDFGIRAFRGGASVQAMERLLDSLSNLGAVLVQEGELERLAPQVNRKKGPEWLTEALRTNAHLGTPAQDHILRVGDAITKRLTC